MKVQNVKVTKIYNTPDGHSHFEDIDLPILYPVGGKQRISKALGSGQIFEFDSDFYIDWHVSQKSLYFIYLQGAQEIEVSDGTKRQFSVGDIVWASDTEGMGHRSRSISNSIGRAMIISV